MANMHAKPALTVRLPAELLADFRAKVAERGDTIAGVVERALAEYVADDEDTREATPAQ